PPSTGHLRLAHLEHRRLELVTELVLNRREIDQLILLHAATPVGRRSKCTGSSSPPLRNERCAPPHTATTPPPPAGPPPGPLPPPVRGWLSPSCLSRNDTVSGACRTERTAR